MRNKYIIAAFVGLLAIGIAGRLVPHVWNVAPVASIALLSAAYFGIRFSTVLTVCVLAFSDLFIGFYDWHVMAAVYAGMVGAGLIGRFVIKRKAFSVVGASLLSSAFFFVLTNWAVWQFGTMYAHSFSGLLDAYAMALPFFKNSLIGDAFFALSFFATAEAFLAARKKVLPKEAAV